MVNPFRESCARPSGEKQKHVTSFDCGHSQRSSLISLGSMPAFLKYGILKRTIRDNQVPPQEFRFPSAGGHLTSDDIPENNPHNHPQRS